MAKATFAAGCFWHVEEAFRNHPGVITTEVGFMGGHTESPTYDDVCTDTTGHAEVVQVDFDPVRIEYVELLDIFWKTHDPTSLNRQGPDQGSQYRSTIFYHNSEQKEIAEESLKKEQAKHKRPLVTEIAPAQKFYPAEEYHQQYLAKKGLAHCTT